MKFPILLILLFNCLVLSVSCNSRKPVEPEIITETKFIKEIVRDTVFDVQADSTYYDAWIECVKGKPVLREPKPNKTEPENKNKEAQKPEKALQKPSVTLDENGKLTVECYKEVEKVKAQLTDRYESLLKEHQKPVYIEKDLTWYQETLMWIGGISLIIIGVILIIKIKN